MSIDNLEARVYGLEKWQERQNGTIGRVDKKVDKLDDKTTARFDKLQYWLLGIAAEVAIAVLLILLMWGG